LPPAIEGLQFNKRIDYLILNLVAEYQQIKILDVNGFPIMWAILIPTAYQKEVIIGLLLGDGSLRRPGSTGNSRL